MNNSLAEVHPELVSEWSEKNLPLTPDDITFGSNKKVWWKGTCGHEWQTSVKARSNGEKCPICSGARVIAGINDLATLEPLLEKRCKVIKSCQHFIMGTIWATCFIYCPALNSSFPLVSFFTSPNHFLMRTNRNFCRKRIR